ncbi:LOW QUALITY PROTEIN: olfactory receptor 5T3-like [Serinus canaria]|uniref:LOW QUALITY PROTEIN: olfactory receptor 5T3-like n=1 Tax=Serinus canaria TaxID=9135 RepID=UPI0021CCF4FE|nr:LOW QUALITY PROTEIN: olfactory receptor 5T3-like [Serinus canaria]
MFSMAGENEMFASQFILLGFTTQADLQVMFFVLFLALCVVTLLGNLGVIMLIRIDPCLCTPMYFFLSHLSLLDICCSSTIIIPWSLRDVLVEKKVISFGRCVTQFFSFATWATTECHVLAAMAHNHYVATCRPLLYSVPMSPQLHSPHHIPMFQVPFCHSWAIEHLVCDRPPLLALSCSDTRSSEAVVAAMVGLNVLSTAAHPGPSWCPPHLSWLLSRSILVSSPSILTAILRISQHQGDTRPRPPALSTRPPSLCATAAPPSRTCACLQPLPGAGQAHLPGVFCHCPQDEPAMWT